MSGNGRHLGYYTVLTLALLVAVGVGYQQYNSRRNLEVMVNNQYYRSFYDLMTSVENVRVGLGKSLAAGSPTMQVASLSDVWREAGSAQSNLNSLPISHNLLMRTSTFLTQVGDFSFVTAKKLASQIELTAEDWNQINELKQQSDSLVKDLEGLQADVVSGDMNWVELARYANSDLKDAPAATGAMNTGFTKVDEQIQQIPTLIYDGPFSDHLERREPLGVTGENISADQAKEVAKNSVPFDASQYLVYVEEEIRGKIPGYRIKLEPSGDSSKNSKSSGKPSAIVDITKVGGHIMMMSIDHEYNETKISLEDGVKSAEQFLRSIGMNNMAATYASEASGVAVIPFVYMQEGVTIYPDLVKVKVALDTGDIVGYEAAGYLMSHRIRQIPVAQVTSEEAMTHLSSSFQINGEPKLAMIPVDIVASDEVLCWELSGTSFGDEYYIYVNAITGGEEKVLQVISTEEGRLTI